VIPQTAQGKEFFGTVAAVGKGRTAKDGRVFPLDVFPGDYVLFGKWSGTEIEIDGLTYRIMAEEEILGVVQRANARR
jgi:chaperonin GroES